MFLGFLGFVEQDVVLFDSGGLGCPQIGHGDLGDLTLLPAASKWRSKRPHVALGDLTDLTVLLTASLNDLKRSHVNFSRWKWLLICSFVGITTGME